MCHGVRRAAALRSGRKTAAFKPRGMDLGHGTPDIPVRDLSAGGDRRLPGRP
jgi:hypothetical protein